MTELPDNDVTRDAKLTAQYRAAAQDMPPPALDAAILAAARREVGARPRPAGFSFAWSWRGPLSVAAVIVLSVSVVMLMREEAPDLVAPPRADVPPTESKPKSLAGAEESEASRERGLTSKEQTPKGIGLKPSNSMPSSGLGMRQPDYNGRAPKTAKDALANRAESDAVGTTAPAKRRDAFGDADDMRNKKAAAAPEPQRQAAKPDAAKEFVQAPAPAAAAPRVAEAQVDKTAPAVGAIAGRLAENKVQAKPAAPSMDRDRAAAEPAERAQSRDIMAKQLADAAPVPPAKQAPIPEAMPAPVPQAKPAPPPAPAAALTPRPFVPAPPAAAVAKLEKTPDLAPEKWLERIEELRKQGRLDEARASLAEFKKRYPDYRLPESLRDGIKP